MALEGVVVEWGVGVLSVIALTRKGMRSRSILKEFDLRV